MPDNYVNPEVIKWAREQSGLTIEALGNEHLAPVVDGEYYRNVRKVTFKIGPRVRIPKVVGRPLWN